MRDYAALDLSFPVTAAQQRFDLDEEEYRRLTLLALDSVATRIVEAVTTPPSAAPNAFQSLGPSDINATGTTTLTMGANAREFVVELTPNASTGAYTRKIVLPEAGRTEGDRVTVSISMPASTNPTLTFHTSSDTSTAFLTILGDSDAIDYQAVFFFDGDVWKLLSFARADGAGTGTGSGLDTSLTSLDDLTVLTTAGSSPDVAVDGVPYRFFDIAVDDGNTPAGVVIYRLISSADCDAKYGAHDEVRPYVVYPDDHVDGGPIWDLRAGSNIPDYFERTSAAPDTIMGMIAWYDAGGPSITAVDGSQPSTWADRGPGGLDAPRITGGAYYKTDRPEGPVFRFAPGDGFAAPGVLNGLTTGITTVVMASCNTNGIICGSTSGHPLFAIYHVGIQTFHYLGNSGHITGGNAMVPGNPMLDIVSYDGANIRQRNQRQEVEPVAATGSMALEGDLLIGRGSGGSAGDLLDGDIWHIIPYNRALTVKENHQIEAYLAERHNAFNRPRMLFFGDSKYRVQLSNVTVPPCEIMKLINGSSGSSAAEYKYDCVCMAHNGWTFPNGQSVFVPLFAQDFLPGQDATCFVEFNTNDVSGGVYTAAQIWANAQLFCNSLTKIGSKRNILETPAAMSGSIAAPDLATFKTRREDYITLQHAGFSAIAKGLMDLAANTSIGVVNAPLTLATVGTGSAPTITTSTNHGLSNGDLVFIQGASSTPSVNNTSLNDSWTITVTGANTFTIGPPAPVTVGGSGGVVATKLTVSSLNPVLFGDQVHYTDAGIAIVAVIEANAFNLIKATEDSGLLIPKKMTGTQRDAIASPTEGLFIYNTTTHKLNFRAAAAWEAVTSS